LPLPIGRSVNVPQSEDPKKSSFFHGCQCLHEKNLERAALYFKQGVQLGGGDLDNCRYNLAVCWLKQSIEPPLGDDGEVLCLDDDDVEREYWEGCNKNLQVEATSLL
jgi:hypothetical protein